MTLSWPFTERCEVFLILFTLIWPHGQVAFIKLKHAVYNKMLLTLLCQVIEVTENITQWIIMYIMLMLHLTFGRGLLFSSYSLYCLKPCLCQNWCQCWPLFCSFFRKRMCACTGRLYRVALTSRRLCWRLGVTSVLSTFMVTHRFMSLPGRTTWSVSCECVVYEQMLNKGATLGHMLKDVRVGKCFLTRIFVFICFIYNGAKDNLTDSCRNEQLTSLCELNEKLHPRVGFSFILQSLKVSCANSGTL